MKRGLKESPPLISLQYSRVATYAPMKRGLKGHTHHRVDAVLRGSNLCPDEKGTESRDRTPSCGQDSVVATYAPMKRGLKEPRIPSNAFAIIVATYAPMKRGLKGVCADGLVA